MSKVFVESHNDEMSKVFAKGRGRLTESRQTRAQQGSQVEALFLRIQMKVDDAGRLQPFFWQCCRGIITNMKHHRQMNVRRLS